MSKSRDKGASQSDDAKSDELESDESPGAEEEVEASPKGKRDAKSKISASKAPASKTPASKTPASKTPVSRTAAKQGAHNGGALSGAEKVAEKIPGRTPEDERWERTKANAKTIAGAVLLALFIRIVLFEAFEIDGPSMEPTLLNGDRVVVAKFMYGLFLPFTDEAVFSWGIPEVGNVVIVRSPFDNIDIVKRVIGVPGDVIEIRDDVVYRNGDPLLRRIVGPCRNDRGVEAFDDCEWVEEGVGDHTWRTSRSRLSVPDSMEPSEVPPNHILVLGDHRDRSNDSRNPQVGMIPASRVKGRALAIYWSNDGYVRWDRIFESVQ
jgi:signal peptidase I